VDVVRHYDKGVDVEIRVKRRDLVPGALDHFAGGIETHFSVDNLAEVVHSVASTDGNYVQTGGPIVEPPQTYRTTMMSLRVVRHAVSSDCSPVSIY
jgi:hypothetical protein